MTKRVLRIEPPARVLLDHHADITQLPPFNMIYRPTEDLSCNIELIASGSVKICPTRAALPAGLHVFFFLYVGVMPAASVSTRGPYHRGR